jgi:hypothetical protein
MQTFDVLSPDGEPLFLANFLNEKKAKLEEHERPRHRWVRNQEELDAFLRQHDILGRATYHTVAKLKPGSWRKKENVHATLFIWAETDFKDHPGLGREEICRRIEAIPDRIKPTFCVFSGHGVHLYWLLKEPEDASPGEAQRRIEEALALACNYIGGDPHVVDTARLLRTPGSHNTREPGESLPVRFEAVEMSRRYDLGDLVDFWLEAHPILPSPIKTNGHAQGAFDYQPGGSEGPTAEGPVHIEVRLAAMRFKGRGDTAINPTQLAATASLTGAGRPIVETVAKVLAATQAAVKDDDRCVSWDWAAEEAEILRMCYGLVNKRWRRTAKTSAIRSPTTCTTNGNRRFSRASGHRFAVAALVGRTSAASPGKRRARQTTPRRTNGRKNHRGTNRRKNMRTGEPLPATCLVRLGTSAIPCRNSHRCWFRSSFPRVASATLAGSGGR